MDTRICVHHVTDLTHLQSKCCILKWLLHLSSAKCTKVSSILSRATLTELCSDPLEILCTLNLGLEVSNVLDSLVLGACDWFVSVGVVWVSGANVLLEDVAASYFRHFSSRFTFKRYQNLCARGVLGFWGFEVLGWCVLAWPGLAWNWFWF